MTSCRPDGTLLFYLEILSKREKTVKKIKKKRKDFKK